MNDFLEKVKCFHQMFNAPVLETPQIPSEERCNLRVKLIQEELDEMKEAIKNNDVIEVADSFGDLMVVLCGSILEFGMGEKFNQLFNEVHRSNMSKSCCTQQEAIETLLHYKQKDGTEGYYKEVDGKWLVYRSGDDKVLKSINYSPANLKSILNGLDQ
jgi:predicted HAD superfamily Cof-like phosphohydrolase